MEDEKGLIINWFPGHMVRTLRVIDAEIKLCDVIVYMLDARCPLSCLNPKFDEHLMRKPVLFVLNKSDLAAPGVLDYFKKSDEYQEIYRKKRGEVAVITLDSTLSGATKKAVDAIKRLLAERIETAASKGIKKTIRSIVIGVTNSGKSTFINNMSNKGKTVTGDRPGVTKQKQWVTAGDNFWILDTPGTLWPSFEVPQTAKNLAYVGSIKDDVLDIIGLSRELILDLESLESGCVAKRFGSADFDEICKKRGYVLKGGILDEERAAKAILVEFRAGKIGRFNLDKVERKAHPLDLSASVEVDL
ncbi:MAG: ribosome biogenesis GTPase YlqF [Firmicutes bacterium]|nr:ribosome biogenesis GTPase YlqF [Bacillota bacterium]